MTRLRRRFADESGIALHFAIAAAAVFTVSGTAAVAYATQNYGSAARSTADQKALALAEAGLNYAFATLKVAPDPRDGDSVPSTRVDVATGEYIVFYGELVGSTWTLTGEGHVRNPTGPGTAEIVRKVSGRARLGSTRRSSANNAVWNYLYADELTGCTQFSNSVVVDVPVYIRGNLCMANSAQLTGYSVRVGGNFTTSQSAGIGVLGAPVQEVHIGGTCSYGNQVRQCGPETQIYSNVITNEPSGLTKPQVDLPYWYQEARPGPMHNCTSGSFPGGFDNDNVLNRSRATVDLTPAQAYDCQFRDADGFLVGRIAWTPGTPGTLIIHGTIFFDGDIHYSKDSAVYQGRGTIYSSGKITFANRTQLCGIAGCANNWNPQQNLLAFVAGSSTDADSFTVGNYSYLQAAVYAVNDFREGNNTTTWGPVIARQIYLQNSTIHHYIPIGTLVPGMPATYEEVATVEYEPGSWG